MRHFFFALHLILASSVLACGSSRPAESLVGHQTPALRIGSEKRISQGSEAQIEHIVLERLRGKGAVVADDDVDAHLAVYILARSPKRVLGGLFYVQGQETASVQVQLKSLEGVVLQSVVADINIDSNGAVDQEDVAALAEEVGDGPALENFARVRQETRRRTALAQIAADRIESLARQKAQDEAERVEREKLEQAKRADEARWQVAKVACENPRNSHACDAAKGYLAGPGIALHIEEAKALLHSQSQTLEVMESDEAWSALDLANCLHPKTSDACWGVRAFVNRYPTHARATEAKAVLAKGEASIENLEVVRARQEASKVETTQPVSPSSGWSASPSTSSSGGPVHVRGYFRKNGTYVQPHYRRR